MKLIYNGEPDSDGNCTNTTGDSTRIGVSAFNSNSSSPADVGYMYGTRYPKSAKTSSDLQTPYVYGNDVTYSGGIYTLTDTMTSTGTWSTDYNTLNNNHYTCFSTGTTCTSVYYIYYTTSSRVEFIPLTNGKKVEDALDDMFINTTDSIIKTQIDNWYNTNLSTHTNYLEDTIYCNDRSISDLGGWRPDGGSTTSNYNLYFNPRNRVRSTYTPTLTCSQVQDRFTVSSSKGNGALTYPVGLITSDEVMYAGGVEGLVNETYYLYTNQDYWTSSSDYFSNLYAHEISVGFAGDISDYCSVGNEYGVRPVIAINSASSKVFGGDGASTNPYILVPR